MEMHENRGKMRALVGIVLAGLMLMGCTELGRFGEDFSDLSKRNWQNLQKSAWRIATYNPEEPAPFLPTVRYCYKADSDIICYARPQPQLKAKLIGYQGPPPDEYAYISPEQPSLEVAPPLEASPQAATIEVNELPDPVGANGESTASSQVIPQEAEASPRDLFANF